MLKKNFREPDIRLQAQKNFIEIFNSEKGQDVLEFLEYIFCDQLEPNIENVYGTYVKLGQAKAIKHIRYMLNTLTTKTTNKGEENETKRYTRKNK